MKSVFLLSVFQKYLAQLMRKEQSAFENRLKTLESNLNSSKMLEEYNKCKNKLEEIYDSIVESVGVKLHCMKREKNQFFFVKLRKSKSGSRYY